MGYSYNARQLSAIQRMLSGEHNIITNFVAGERADVREFNNKYDEIQGCLSYIKSNADAKSFSELTDVKVESPADKDIMSYKADEGLWVNIPAPPLRLSDLEDVLIESLRPDQILEYDGQKWLNVDTPIVIKRLDLLQDVEISAIKDKQVLRYDDVGDKWVNHSLKLGDLEDVIMPNLRADQVLEFDGNKWINVDTPVVIKRLDLLQDVGILNPTEGQYLRYDDRDDRWVNYSLTLDTLTGIDIENASDGQVLKYNAERQLWTNAEPNKALSGLINDVDIQNVISGQILRFNDQTTKWENVTPPAIIKALSGLVEDVKINNPQHNNVIRFNANNSLWENKDIAFSTLSDVAFSGLANSHIPIFNNGTWGNVSFNILNLNDVSPANPTNGQTLVFSSSLNKFVSTTLNLNSLSDVLVTTPQDGNYLVFNQAQNKWLNKEPPKIINFLSGLSDVGVEDILQNQLLAYDSANNKWINKFFNVEDLKNTNINSPIQKNLLSYSGGKWVNSVINLSYLSDFSIATPLNKQILYYDAGESKWKNKHNTLVDLVDIEIVTPGLHDALLYNSVTEKWVNKPLRLDTHISDTNINNPQAGQSIVFNGLKWQNINLNNSLSGLGDVHFENSPSDKQIIVFDSASSKWINSAPQYKVSDLIDTSVEAATNGQVLAYKTDSSEWVAADPLVSNLKDVQLDNLVDGQFLKYDAIEQKWVNMTQQAIISTLSGLNDVSLDSLTDGQIITYDSASAKWVNDSLEIEKISNVNVLEPSNGQTIVFDGENNEWVNGVPSMALGELNNVVINSPAPNQSLIFDGVNWINGVTETTATTQTTYQMPLDTTVTRIDDVQNIIDRIYVVENVGDWEIYIGFESTINSENAFILYPGDILRITLTSSGAIYGFSGFGLGRVAVIRGR